MPVVADGTRLNAIAAGLKPRAPVAVTLFIFEPSMPNLPKALGGLLQKFRQQHPAPTNHGAERQCQHFLASDYFRKFRHVTILFFAILHPSAKLL